MLLLIIPESDVTGEPEERITDMSQLYQIFPDDVLGSGQFGIVYGGNCLYLLHLNTYAIECSHLLENSIKYIKINISYSCRCDFKDI